MDPSVIVLGILVVAVLALQGYLTFLQYRNYQKAVDSLRGEGRILGIGMRKGGMSIRGGAIVILAWNEEKDRIEGCKRLQGPTMWKRFTEVEDYVGMTLNEVRKCGVEEDYALNRRARDKVPYSPLLDDKRRKKGAVIQAVESIDRYLARQMKAADKGRQQGPKKTGGIDREAIRRRAEARKRAIRAEASHGEHDSGAKTNKGG
ncbi:MAG: transcriptional regulator GutM [Eubacterium sp.]|nr:transcriptional regulator GutM [Eubacterium sp.]